MSSSRIKLALGAAAAVVLAAVGYGVIEMRSDGDTKAVEPTISASSAPAASLPDLPPYHVEEFFGMVRVPVLDEWSGAAGQPGVISFNDQTHCALDTDPNDPRPVSSCPTVRFTDLTQEGTGDRAVGQCPFPDMLPGTPIEEQPPGKIGDRTAKHYREVLCKGEGGEIEVVQKTWEIPGKLRIMTRTSSTLGYQEFDTNLLPNINWK